MKLITLLKDVSRPLRIKYYDWKAWQLIISNIKKDRKRTSTDTQNIKWINKPGIVLSFDDSFRVDGWHKVKDLFGYYDVKVTFNVNAIHHFEGQREHTQEEIDKLLELQFNGHEIAHHTLKHYDAKAYTKEYGVNKWISDEIDSLFKWLERQKHSLTGERFKRPVSFAFPYFSENEVVVDRIGNYFKIVRGGKRGGKGNLLTPFEMNGYIPSIDIDRNVIPNQNYIKKVLKHVKKTGKNIVFTCHSILDDDDDWNKFGYGDESIKSGEYRISPERLAFIIKEAKKNDLEFYTTAEVAGIATFIDENFENHIRNILSIPKNRWIEISRLMKIKELNLSNKGIKNLDGLQYFLNLEKLNISNNPVKDTRLIERLPNLRVLVNNSKITGIESRETSMVN